MTGEASMQQVKAVPAVGARTSITAQDVRVTLDGVGGTKSIIDGLTFDIEEGSFVSVLGESGAGKTTLLRAIGGLQPISHGSIQCAGRDVDGPPEGAVVVFQDYQNSLLPWRSVRRNVALGIERKLSRAECDAQVDEALATVGLEKHSREYPWRLSGGMQQRVQIARALAMRPRILLMDEPFGALDAMTKANLQDELLKVHSLTGATILFVTHDVDEAVYLSDRLLVLRGRPASVGIDLPVHLPRPRNQLETKESPEYLRLRHAILSALQDRP